MQEEPSSTNLFMTSLQEIPVGKFSVLRAFGYAVSFKINRASTAALTHTALSLLSTFSFTA